MALHLGALGGDKSLLAAFLTGYEWPATRDLLWRAMAATLVHQFDVVASVATVMSFDDVRTLADLAVALWDVT